MVTKSLLRKRLATVGVLVLAATVVCGVLACRDKPSENAESTSPANSIPQSTPPAETVSAPVNTQKVVGRWLRTDSPYVIEILEVSLDGTLRAGYFNPRPINVSVAKVEDKSGTLEVFVELRDTGYPGSNYTLSYNPKNDTLEGTYFQATMQQKFNVAFMRMPAER